MGYAYDESPFVPFNVPQVGPTIPAMPPPDMRDAEITKLRADLDQARRDRNSAVECAEVLRGYVAEGKAEIAKLRAERDEWRDKAHSLNEDRAAARDAVFKEGLARIEAEKQLAAARAALDGEREQHDETQRALNLGIEFAFDAADGRPGLDTACEIIAAHDARRAAESNASRGGEGKP